MLLVGGVGFFVVFFFSASLVLIFLSLLENARTDRRFLRMDIVIQDLSLSEQSKAKQSYY